MLSRWALNWTAFRSNSKRLRRWDLWAKAEGKPVWKLVADLTPEEFVSCIDFRYLSDVLTRDDALAMLGALEPGKADREAEIRRDGYPAYITSAGWLGYPEEKVRRLCREAVDDGWNAFKMKVGIDRESDARRAAVMREEIGPDRDLMADANQVWDVPEAISWTEGLAGYGLRWIEEPTSPDDVLGHAAIRRALAPTGIGVATGEHCANRVMFKQLLQAEAIDYCQVDACRVGGLNEVLAVLLLAARFGIPVCPHAGGVGLCEYVQHLAIFDYLCVSASLDDRIVEYVDHLHEHFVDPVVVRDGHYMPPSAAGYTITMRPESLRDFVYPEGPAWLR